MVVVVVVRVVRERERKGERNNDNMGFFANIPKPPKLAGFFGDEEEEENASDGTNDAEGEKKKKEGKITTMEEIGGVMEDLELENAQNARKAEEEVDIPSTSSEQKLLTPMDLLNASRSDGGGNVTTNSGQQQMAPPPMLPPMPGAQHPMFGGQMPPRGPPPPGMPPPMQGMMPPQGPPPGMGGMNMFPPLGTGEGPPLTGMTAPLGMPPPGPPGFHPRRNGGGRGRGAQGSRGGVGNFNQHYTQSGKHRRIVSGPRRDGRPRFQGELMTGEEIEQILRIQWKATHPDQEKAYSHDYYHQAFLSKNNPGRLREPFCPDELRELPSHVKEKRGEVTFVPGLEGLGKVPFSNVRTPKQLLQIPSGPEEENDDSGDDENEPRLRLANEPLLAARIMIEDAMYLLLDVDDIDRLLLKNEFAADDAMNRGEESGENDADKENEGEKVSVKQKTKDALTQRKKFLLEGLVTTLRLPESPVLNSDESDVIFQRLVSLPKGRVMLSSVLKALDPASMSAAQLVWAVFRNVGKIAKFAEKSAAKTVKGSRAAQAAAAAMAFQQRDGQSVITDVDRLIRTAAEVSSMLPKDATEGALGSLIVGISYADTQNLLPNCLVSKRSPRESIQETLAIVIERGKVVHLADGNSQAWETSISFAFDMFNRQATALVSNEKSKSDPDARLPRSLMRAFLPQLDATGKQRIAELNACVF